jgi:hypothetical protein
MSEAEPLQDDPELLARIAALQLIPTNLHYLDALTRLTAFAARCESGTDLAACVDGFESLVGAPVSQLRESFDGFVTAQVPFHSQTFLVLQGLVADSGTAALHLLATVFGPRRHEFPELFTRNVEACARFLMTTSQLVRLRMRLGRYATAPPSAEALVIAEVQELETLAQSLRFDEDSLFAGLPAALVSYLRRRLFIEADQLPPWDVNDLDQALIAQPFVLAGGGRVVVATPFELMVTLRQAICLEATEHACHGILHEALTEHATRMTRHICLPLFDNANPEVRTAVGLGELDGVFDTEQDARHTHSRPQPGDPNQRRVTRAILCCTSAGTNCRRRHSCPHCRCGLAARARPNSAFPQRAPPPVHQLQGSGNHSLYVGH